MGFEKKRGNRSGHELVTSFVSDQPPSSNEMERPSPPVWTRPYLDQPTISFSFGLSQPRDALRIVCRAATSLRMPFTLFSTPCGLLIYYSSQHRWFVNFPVFFSIFFLCSGPTQSVSFQFLSIGYIFHPRGEQKVFIIVTFYGMSLRDNDRHSESFNNKCENFYQNNLSTDWLII